MNASTASALDFPIAGAGLLSQAAQSRGYRRFAEVAEAVRTLPYGRVQDPQDVLAVLEDRKGTCSSKHRLLAALAHECGHTEVLLMLGLYEMSDRNTPGVGPVLRAEGLMAVPEAHCYLMCNGQRYDFTGLPTGTVSPLESLIEERAVSPSDLPSVKASYHRAALANWAQAHAIDADRVWAVRERCIELLANPTPHADARDVPAPARDSGERTGGHERYAKCRMGTVEHIFIAPSRGEPMMSLRAVEALADCGLRGDRYAVPRNRKSADYQVTLIEIEAIEEFSKTIKLQLAPYQPRRNLVTSGIRLNDLCGKRVRVGDVELEGLELCEPCLLFAKRTYPEVVRFFVHRGGLRCRIVRGGIIQVGAHLRQCTEPPTHSSRPRSTRCAGQR